MLQTKMKASILIVVAIFFSTKIVAQGCSDAGFCSIVNQSKSFKKDSVSFKYELKLGVVYGLGEGKVNIVTPTIGLRIQLEKNLSWSNKITLQNANGRLGNNFGAGDWFSTLAYDIPIKNKKHRVTPVLGVKLPLNTSNGKYKGTALPLGYQSSIATFDIITGLNYSFKNLYFQAAVQVPTVNFNQNTFTRKGGVDSMFATTVGFERKPDVLFRVGYIFQVFKRRWVINPNLLAIYHLQKDTYLDGFGNRLPIQGSDGFTLNVNLLTSYHFTPKHALELSVGVPLVVRKTRPDGLTREFAIGLEYQYLF